MNRRISIIPKIILVLIAAFSLALIKNPNNSFASGAVMKISPVATEVYIQKGNKQNYQFTIENTGEQSVKFKLYTAPYNVTNEDYDANFDDETAYNQIMRWITFQDDSGSFVSNPTYSLEPGEKKTIVYRVTVPESIPEGGQYCIIFAESIEDEKKNDGTPSIGLTSRSRVSLIILGHGEGQTENVAEITDFQLTGFFTSNDIDAMVKVKNNGNTDFLSVYSLVVESLFGTKLYSTSDNFVVLPETERKYTTSWSETPLFGIYKVKFSVNALDQDKEESHFILIMPAFMIVILLLLLTSIIVWIIMLTRKRKERSSRLVV